MKYFESRTYGEVLSRITNDVDTLGNGLNQKCNTAYYFINNYDWCSNNDVNN